MTASIDQLITQRDQLGVWLTRELEARRSAGYDTATNAQNRALADFKALGARIRFAQSEERRSGTMPGGAVTELRSRINSGDPARKTSMNYPSVYTRHGRASYISDLVKVQTMRDGDGSSRRRLESHTEDVQRGLAYQEHRDLSRIDGQGGYFVPPAWLMTEWIEFARPGRAFANLLQAHPLPGGTDSINVPRILTGAATAVQTADNTQVAEVDITDTFISSPVRTIAGQQSVALQLIDQSPIAFDDVILQDLTADYSQRLDLQTLYGTGSAGQLLGVANTPGIGSVTVSSLTIQGIYNAIANAIQKILTTRFRPPTAIVMHPRRWAYLLTLLDENNRPLFVPSTNSPFNAAGVQSAVESEGVVGTVLGLPVVTDSNVTTTAGSESGGGTEDVIYVLRAPDVVLYESGVRARVLNEPLAQTLTVLIQLYAYSAIGVRFPGSIVEIGGLTAPVF